MTKSKHHSATLDGLACLLANTYVLYVKTQNFHWHVTGSQFYSLHKMFEEQYEALAEAIDVLAERMRAMAMTAPATLKEFIELTTLQEPKGDYSAKKMIAELGKDHVAIASQLVKLFELFEAVGDEVTLDILIQRKTEHDKFVWMLRSSVE